MFRQGFLEELHVELTRRTVSEVLTLGYMQKA